MLTSFYAGMIRVGSRAAVTTSIRHDW